MWQIRNWITSLIILQQCHFFTATKQLSNPKPNILYIMADDLNADWKNDRLSYMPNLKHYFKDGGMDFINHVAAVPVCGPSRSSMLLGRYPHNTGYLMNGDLDSVEAYLGKHNNTVGKWLSDAGYHTSFLGKYVNGCENHVPSGWSHWGGFIQTYNFYNASMYDVDWPDDGSEPIIKTKVMTGIHQADFLINETLNQVEVARTKDKPFFISVTPVMPHWGTCYGPKPAMGYSSLDPHWEMSLTDAKTGRQYKIPISPCPTDRNRHAFDNYSNPHIKQVWNVTIKGPRPKFMRGLEKNDADVNSFVEWREDIGFQNRSASLIDLDEMIGGIMKGLETLGVLNNTYIIFTSDNGYHLGEHKMPFGKGEPYETDIRLPMYITGPSVPRNVTMYHPTTHLDITATIVDISKAQQHSPSILDGKSFYGELSRYDELDQGTSRFGDEWRQFSFSEFFANTNTWQLIRVVNATHKFTLTWWCTNETEIFNLKLDHWQTQNIADQPGLAATIQSEFGPTIVHLGNCSGTQCSKSIYTDKVEVGKAIPPGSLQCYNLIPAKSARIGFWNFNLNQKTSKVVGLHGWTLNFLLDGHDKPRGFSPVTVRTLVDGKFLKQWPSTIANISRPDIMPGPNATGVTARIPNPDHGFSFTDIPADILKGKHSFRVVDLPSQKPINSKNPKLCLCDATPCPC